MKARVKKRLGSIFLTLGNFEGFDGVAAPGIALQQLLAHHPVKSIYIKP